MDHYVAFPALEEWIAKKGATLKYSDGEEIRVGDYVECGLRFGDEPYYGHVVAISIATGLVIVDEHCNVPPRAYPVEKLTFAGREQEDAASGGEEVH